MQFNSAKEDDRRRAATASVRADLAGTIARLLGNEDDLATTIPGLLIMRRHAPEPPASFVFEPSLSMIVQGSKRVLLGDAAYRYNESRFLLTTVNLPTIAQVLEASPERPYISALLKLDLVAAKKMIADIDLADPDAAPNGSGMATAPAGPELFDALARLIRLLDSPTDIPILGALIQREILYRVLTGPAGGRLRQIVHLGTQGNRIARAIAWLRDNYARPLRIGVLADVTGMGVSTLHHHFRLMTAMSPLQFQKHLRLHEARRLMLSEELDAGNAALRVGYESATQFSREYRRLFGAPPMRDVKTLRLNHAVQPPDAARAAAQS